MQISIFRGTTRHFVSKSRFFETQNIKKKALLDKEKAGYVYKNIKKIFSDAELLEVKNKD